MGKFYQGLTSLGRRIFFDEFLESRRGQRILKRLESLDARFESSIINISKTIEDCPCNGIFFVFLTELTPES